jgi:hypothetical protein
MPSPLLGKSKNNKAEVRRMGERTQFDQGDHAPNDGQYMEIGEAAFHMGVNNPKIVTLKKGDPFPETSNHNRKWKRKDMKL